MSNLTELKEMISGYVWEDWLKSEVEDICSDDEISDYDEAFSNLPSTNDIEQEIYTAISEHDLNYGDLCDCLESNTAYVLHFELDSDVSSAHDALYNAIQGILMEDVNGMAYELIERAENELETVFSVTSGGFLE